MDFRNSVYRSESTLVKNKIFNYMQKFCDYRKQYNEYCEFENGELRLNSVPVLLGFMGFLKSHLSGSWRQNYKKPNEINICRNCKVFFRGHTKDYDNLPPSLFRNFGNVENIKEESKSRLKAFNQLCTKIKLVIPKNDRFQYKNIGAVLQHYSFNTPWVDVVDNIYTAIWFATHTKKDGKYIKNDKGDGWLTFVATKDMSGNRLKVVDLRSEHSSLSLRCTMQHGFSLLYDKSVEPLDNFIVAKVKFPVERFQLDGTLFSVDNFFPSKEFDDTARILDDKADKINELCRDIENKFKIKNKCLGNAERGN